MSKFTRVARRFQKKLMEKMKNRENIKILYTIVHKTTSTVVAERVHRIDEIFFFIFFFFTSREVVSFCSHSGVTQLLRGLNYLHISPRESLREIFFVFVCRLIGSSFPYTAAVPSIARTSYFVPFSFRFFYTYIFFVFVLLFLFKALQLSMLDEQARINICVIFCLFFFFSFLYHVIL